MSTFVARTIAAEGDGVGPAVFLQKLPGSSAPRFQPGHVGQGPQYLVNVPDGFSRLVLEHKTRPSPRLKGLFLTSLHPRAAGDLGSLLLQLSQDGHQHLEICGPRGTASFVHALRHLLRWRHPKVFVREVVSSHRAVFQDGDLLVFPVFRQRPGHEGPCLGCLRGQLGIQESKGGQGGGVVEGQRSQSGMPGDGRSESGTSSGSEPEQKRRRLRLEGCSSSDESSSEDSIEKLKGDKGFREGGKREQEGTSNEKRRTTGARSEGESEMGSGQNKGSGVGGNDASADTSSGSVESGTQGSESSSESESSGGKGGESHKASEGRKGVEVKGKIECKRLMSDEGDKEGAKASSDSGDSEEGGEGKESGGNGGSDTSEESGESEASEETEESEASEESWEREESGESEEREDDEKAESAGSSDEGKESKSSSSSESDSESNSTKGSGEGKVGSLSFGEMDLLLSRQWAPHSLRSTLLGGGRGGLTPPAGLNRPSAREPKRGGWKHPGNSAQPGSMSEQPAHALLSRIGEHEREPTGLQQRLNGPPPKASLLSSKPADAGKGTAGAKKSKADAGEGTADDGKGTDNTGKGRHGSALSGGGGGQSQNEKVLVHAGEGGGARRGRRLSKAGRASGKDGLCRQPAHTIGSAPAKVEPLADAQVEPLSDVRLGNHAQVAKNGTTRRRKQGCKLRGSRNRIDSEPSKARADRRNEVDSDMMSDQQGDEKDEGYKHPLGSISDYFPCSSLPGTTLAKDLPLLSDDRHNPVFLFGEDGSLSVPSKDMHRGGGGGAQGGLWSPEASGSGNTQRDEPLLGYAVLVKEQGNAALFLEPNGGSTCHEGAQEREAHGPLDYLFRFECPSCAQWGQCNRVQVFHMASAPVFGASRHNLGQGGIGPSKIENIWVGGRGVELGYLASLRVLRRLHGVCPTGYPLPSEEYPSLPVPSSPAGAALATIPEHGYRRSGTSAAQLEAGPKADPAWAGGVQPVLDPGAGLPQHASGGSAMQGEEGARCAGKGAPSAGGQVLVSGPLSPEDGAGGSGMQGLEGARCARVVCQLLDEIVIGAEGNAERVLKQREERREEQRREEERREEQKRVEERRDEESREETTRGEGERVRQDGLKKKEGEAAEENAKARTDIKEVAKSEQESKEEDGMGDSDSEPGANPGMAPQQEEIDGGGRAETEQEPSKGSKGPSKGSKHPSFDPWQRAVVDESDEEEGSSGAALDKGVNGPSIAHKFPDGVDVLFLGTGSAAPGKYRGSSGILLSLPWAPQTADQPLRGPNDPSRTRGGAFGGDAVRKFEGLTVLLDAGPGTLGQLKRCFGEGALGPLSLVWVSHKHADHSLGLLSVLFDWAQGATPTRGGPKVPSLNQHAFGDSERSRRSMEPVQARGVALPVIGPSAVGAWLREVRQAVTASGLGFPDYSFSHCSQWVQGGAIAPQPNHPFSQTNSLGPRFSNPQGGPMASYGLAHQVQPPPPKPPMAAFLPSGQGSSFAQDSAGAAKNPMPPGNVMGRSDQVQGYHLMENHHMGQGRFMQNNPRGQNILTVQGYALVAGHDMARANLMGPRDLGVQGHGVAASQHTAQGCMAPGFMTQGSMEQRFMAQGSAAQGSVVQGFMGQGFMAQGYMSEQCPPMAQLPLAGPTMDWVRGSGGFWGDACSVHEPPQQPVGEPTSGLGSRSGRARQEDAAVVLRTVPAVHCSDAWSVVIERRQLCGGGAGGMPRGAIGAGDGGCGGGRRGSSGGGGQEGHWKIVYSADTRPTARLAAAGQGCALLVHEATFSEELQARAEKTRHSTFVEALEVSRNMQAQYTVLTHFSHRHQELPAIDKDSHPRACTAFDGMLVSGSTIGDLVQAQQDVIAAARRSER